MNKYIFFFRGSSIYRLLKSSETKQSSAKPNNFPFYWRRTRKKI